jgi:hypothetical protein
MNDTIQQTAADTATEAAIDAHISGDREKAVPLFNRATVEHQRQAATESAPRETWRDGTELAPMPPPPAVTSEIDAAIAKLNGLGGRHAELVSSWGADAPVQIEYARAAFRDVAANDPALIAAVDRSGIGDHASILEFLARQGRLSAGLMGDFTISRNSNESHIPMNRPPAGSTGNNGLLETQGELNRMLAANPPGSMGYKANANRIQQLYRMLAGSGAPVGVDGRRL